MDDQEARKLARAIERARKGSVAYQILRGLLIVIGILGVLLIVGFIYRWPIVTAVLGTLPPA